MDLRMHGNECTARRALCVDAALGRFCRMKKKKKRPHEGESERFSRAARYEENSNCFLCALFFSRLPKVIPYLI